MRLRSLFIQETNSSKPPPAGGKAEARIPLLSTAELNQWIEQYQYVIGRSLTEFARNPEARGFMDEAVEAARLLHLCLETLYQKVVV